MYVQEPSVIGRRGCVQREIQIRKWLAADNGHFVWFARVSYGWFIAVHYKLNPLKPKRIPLYLKPQSVPRCKHFSSRL